MAKARNPWDRYVPKAKPVEEPPVAEPSVETLVSDGEPSEKKEKKKGRPKKDG